MEKPAAKSKSKLLKFLPRAASAITFTARKVGFSDGRKLKSQYLSQEPTYSPKVSCMGHIKHSKKLGKNMHLFLLQEMNNHHHHHHHHHPFSSSTGSSKNKPSVMKPVFFLPEAKKIPSRIQNGAFNNLLMAQIESYGIDKTHEKRGDSQEAEEVVVVGDGGSVGLEPRKEINLWKRRTVAQPKPLDIHTRAKTLR